MVVFSLKYYFSPSFLLATVLLLLPLLLSLLAITVRKKNPAQQKTVALIAGITASLWMVYLMAMNAWVALGNAVIMGVVFIIVALVKKDRHFLIGIGSGVAAVIIIYVVPTLGDWNSGASDQAPLDTTVQNVVASDMQMDLEFVSNGDGTCYVAGCSWYGGTDVEPSPYYSNEAHHLVIPRTSPDGESVVAIGAYAFQDNHDIYTVELPESVTALGERAFYNCTGLQLINLDCVQVIGAEAFRDCSAFTYVSTDSTQQLDSIQDIEDYAFCGCTCLSEISFADSLTEIGAYAFANTSLRNLVINGHTVTLGESAFANCQHLESVDIYASIQPSLPHGLFENCTALQRVYLYGDLDTIGTNAFYGCHALTEVRLPSTLTTVQSCAFYDCYALSSVIYHGDEYTWNSIRFHDGNSNLQNATVIYE